MDIRTAVPEDAAALDDVLQDLIRAGKRTKFSDANFALNHYIAAPHQIRCSVAVDPSGHILGFQSLKHAVENNPYDTPVGWGIIGTHIRPSQARRGIGALLFETTKTAAAEAGLSHIEALIAAPNTPALAFYESLGFRTYKTTSDAVVKCFTLDQGVSGNPSYT